VVEHNCGIALLAQLVHSFQTVAGRRGTAHSWNEQNNFLCLFAFNYIKCNTSLLALQVLSLVCHLFYGSIFSCYLCLSDHQTNMRIEQEPGRTIFLNLQFKPLDHTGLDPRHLRPRVSKPHGLLSITIDPFVGVQVHASWCTLIQN
jgi:hypothetical protein